MTRLSPVLTACAVVCVSLACGGGGVSDPWVTDHGVLSLTRSSGKTSDYTLRIPGGARESWDGVKDNRRTVVNYAPADCEAVEQAMNALLEADGYEAGDYDSHRMGSDWEIAHPSGDGDFGKIWLNKGDKCELIALLY